MKLSKYLVGTLACALMAGCADEDTPAVDNGTQVQEGSSYMAVNLVMSTDAASRAATDGGFDNGTTEEGAVSVAKSVFLFYDASGEFVAKGKIISDDKFLTLTDPDGADNNIESQAIVAVGPTTTKPTQVLAVLNGNGDDLDGLSLADALNATATSISGGQGDFLMTNSTYVEGSNIVNVTAVKEENFVEDPDDVTDENAVDIYVERVATKIQVTKEEPHSDNLTGSDHSLNFQTDAVMRVVIDGWCANAVNTKSYYVKRLNNDWITTSPFNTTTPATSWTGDHRTFWALDDNYTGAGDYKEGPTYAGLTYATWNEAKANKADVVYVHENTIDNQYAQVEGGDNTNVTTVLVAAHIEYAEKSDPQEEDWKQGNIYKYNGVYYTEDVLKQNIVSSGDYYWYYTDSEGNRHWQALAVSTEGNKEVDITFSPAGDETTPGDVTVNVDINKPTIANANGEIILVKGENSTTAVTETDAEKFLNESPYTQNLIGYKNGACYYQVPIEHLSSTNEKKFYGVVRNHSYQLTITDITDIGGAVFNPDKTLPPIPGKETNYYMKAKLKVLAWKVVTQSAVLD